MKEQRGYLFDKLGQFEGEPGNRIEDAIFQTLKRKKRRKVAAFWLFSLGLAISLSTFLYKNREPSVANLETEHLPKEGALKRHAIGMTSDEQKSAKSENHQIEKNSFENDSKKGDIISQKPIAKTLRTNYKKSDNHNIKHENKQEGSQNLILYSKAKNEKSKNHSESAEQKEKMKPISSHVAMKIPIDKPENQSSLPVSSMVETNNSFGKIQETNAIEVSQLNSTPSHFGQFQRDSSENSKTNKTQKIAGLIHRDSSKTYVADQDSSDKGSIAKKAVRFEFGIEAGYVAFRQVELIGNQSEIRKASSKPYFLGGRIMLGINAVIFPEKPISPFAEFQAGYFSNQIHLLHSTTRPGDFSSNKQDNSMIYLPEIQQRTQAITLQSIMIDAGTGLIFNLADGDTKIRLGGGMMAGLFSEVKKYPMDNENTISGLEKTNIGSYGLAGISRILPGIPKKMGMIRAELNLKICLRPLFRFEGDGSLLPGFAGIRLYWRKKD